MQINKIITIFLTLYYNKAEWVKDLDTDTEMFTARRKTLIHGHRQGLSEQTPVTQEIAPGISKWVYITLEGLCPVNENIEK